jgi:hypothetical protein
MEAQRCVGMGRGSAYRSDGLQKPQDHASYVGSISVHGRCVQGRETSANKDTYYSMHPVATNNLQNYWVHRQAYINRQMRGWSIIRQLLFLTNSGDVDPSVRRSTKYNYQEHSINNSNSYCSEPPAASSIDIYANKTDRHSPPTYQQQVPPYPSYHAAAGGIPYFQPQNYQQSAAFHSLSPHPVVVPSGFTETHQSSPGLWRNPATGQIWHASRGLMPPAPPY